MKNKTTLIMVDLQNDFCPGGSLAVPEGDLVVPLANQLQPHFDVVIATQDWHPRDHVSFAANHPGKTVGEVMMVGEVSQILWPVHCVQNTSGAEFHPGLDVHRIDKVIHKGTDKNIDSYSAFFDNAHQRSTKLADFLWENQLYDIYIMGLATDYCVKYSCWDATHLGFNVHIIEDACRGIELKPGDIRNALQEMQEEGVKIVRVGEVVE